MKLNTSINILILFTFIIRSSPKKPFVTRAPKKDRVVFVPPSIKPQMLIFNFDRTIWPDTMDELELPYKINRKHIITDDCGNRLTLYPHTANMLVKMRKLKFKLGLICYCKDYKTVNNLLTLLNVHRLFDYKAFSYNSKFDQIERIHNISKIPCDEMIYFDRDDEEFSELELLDLLSFRTEERGVLLKDIQEAWKIYATKKSQPVYP